MVVIKTSPENAHSVGVVLDAAQWPEVLGTTLFLFWPEAVVTAKKYLRRS